MIRPWRSLLNVAQLLRGMVFKIINMSAIVIASVWEFWLFWTLTDGSHAGRVAISAGESYPCTSVAQWCSSCQWFAQRHEELLLILGTCNSLSKDCEPRVREWQWLDFMGTQLCEHSVRGYGCRLARPTTPTCCFYYSAIVWGNMPPDPLKHSLIWTTRCIGSGRCGAHNNKKNFCKLS
jgi:hypothetical protein